MIGQTDLYNSLLRLKEASALPQFMILVGSKGSGRKTLIKTVFGSNCVVMPDNTVASVRKIVEMSYQVHNQVFIMADADDMSLAAKNALLKVIEECPNNNSYIMTLEDENNTLDTIKSRAVVYYMDRYTSDEIEEYVRNRGLYTSDTINIIQELCDTPGDVELLSKLGVRSFYTYVQKVVDNIANVSGSNAFKIADKISFKEDDGKYDLKLFWKAFMNVCIRRFREDTSTIMRYATGCRITSRYLQELRIKGINKQALFDAWLLSIRDEWIEWN